jgi:hypothetical protein
LLFGSLIHISVLQLQNIWWCAHFDKGFWILERYFLWTKSHLHCLCNGVIVWFLT